MTQAQLGHGLYTLLFCIAIFFLTSAGLAVLYYRMLPSPFWFIFVYVIAWAVLFAFAVDFFGGKVKFGGKKILVLAFVVMLGSALFTHLVWTIVTPRWSYSISTDKSTYGLGEPVTITASLRNTGFITHSFKSASNNPVCVSVMYFWYPEDRYEVWYSTRVGVTEFSVRPGETLERNFIWNQTRNIHTGEEIEPGSYRIYVFIPSDSEGALIMWGPSLFWAWTSINITST